MEKGLDGDIVEVFWANKIDGGVFLDLNKEDLKELGFVALGDRKKIRSVHVQSPTDEISYC